MLGLGVVSFSQLAGQSVAVSEDQQVLDMLEEEKLANEVYVTLYEKWQHHSFQNISSAEQRHMERMLQLAESRGLKLPSSVIKRETGVFQNARMQKFYDQLIKQGDESLVEALKVGALVEETDIQDLRMAIAGTKDPQAIQVYTALMQGSENHLRAFTRNLNRQGIDYTPVVLTATDYQAILDGKNTCSGACCQNVSGLKDENCKGGKGKGNGPGKGKCCASN